MTRKDYVRLAEALRSVRPTMFDADALTDRTSMWSLTVSAVSDSLKAENPRFNEDRFFAACGHNGEVL